MHTKAFIEEMKQLLLQEARTLRGASGADVPEYGRSDEDNATEVADYEARAATTSAASGRLEEVEAALQRIEGNTYGITEEGVSIPEDRLRANPAATTVIS